MILVGSRNQCYIEIIADKRPIKIATRSVIKRMKSGGILKCLDFI